MAKTIFFYDLETSGLDPRDDRIMQFAGQRTDLDLNPIGEPVNLLVKMLDDTLPSPQAIMTTGITPQSTQADGLTESELAQYLQDEIFTPDTLTMGYNNVRFDDEFIRALFWRNFYDPYEWQWSEGRSRWDLLDVVRLTRALRPEGINWPFTESGKATNRLELITKLNGVEHEHAHDALSDVYATIAVAKLIRQHQPQLFEYLLKMRDKREVARLVNLDHPVPFVYASGRYSAEFNKATVAYPLAPAQNGHVLVYDLRYNLEELLEKEGLSFFPQVKRLAYNKCPAVAPLSVLDKADGWTKIGLDQEVVNKHLKTLLAHPEFAERMRTADEEKPEYPPAVDVESAIYDGFLPDSDRAICKEVINRAHPSMPDNLTQLASPDSLLADFHPNFTDERLPELLLHFKARNYPNALSATEARKWDKYRVERLTRQSGPFIKALQSLQEASADPFILEELQLWYESLQPGNY